MKFRKSLLVLASFFISLPLWSQNVTLPNTFVSGTPARAADVNANFETLKNALPGVSSHLFSVSNLAITCPANSGTTVTVGTIAFKAPSDGYAVVTFQGSLRSYSSTEQDPKFGLLAAGSSLYENANGLGECPFYFVPYGSSTGYFLVPSFSHTQVFRVIASIDDTFYAKIYSGRSCTISLEGNLIVQFFPNKY